MGNVRAAAARARPAADSGFRDPRSPVAERMRRYRRNLQSEVAYVLVPVTGSIVAHLVRESLLRRDREVHSRAEIGAAIAAFLERHARER